MSVHGGCFGLEKKRENVQDVSLLRWGKGGFFQIIEIQFLLPDSTKSLIISLIRY